MSPTLDLRVTPPTPATQRDAVALLDALVAHAPATPPPDEGRPLALYGAGNLGRMLAEHFEAVGRAPVAVVDARGEAADPDGFWASRGLTVLAPDRAPASLRAEAEIAVCVATAPYGPVAASLRARGFTHVHPAYDVFDRHAEALPLRNGWFTGGLRPAERDAIADVYEALAHDPKSRAHHLAFVAWHHARLEWLFPEALPTIEDRYLIPEVLAAVGTTESLLDVGAHHGEALQRISTTLGPRLIEAWALEPDAANRAVLQRDIAALLCPVQVLPHAVGRDAGPFGFREGLGYASQRADGNAPPRAFTTIDALSLAPSFVKLHLEGWELDALAGARHTLRTHRPIVAATVYHDRRGLHETLDWLRRELDDVTLHIRQHSHVGTGLVVYAIPNERRRPR